MNFVQGRLNSARLACICIAAVISTLSVVGCAHRNEGAIDYRKSEVIAGAGMDQIGFSSASAVKSQYNGDIEVPALNLEGEQVRLTPLIRKNVSSGAEDTSFTNLDSVSIRLRSAFIEDYSEGPLSYFGDTIAEGQWRGGGEVAVVVRAFQLGKDKKADFRFSDEAIEDGRVVFFSKDVWEKQHLNFDNMPVLGPETYERRPIGLDIAIVELDLSDKVTADLLTKLASLGKVASFPSDPALAVLNSLGETFAQTKTNDIDFRYNILLDAHEGGHPDLPRAILEVGNYVFIRDDCRCGPIHWGNLLLDENTGSLYYKDFRYNESDGRILPGMIGVDTDITLKNSDQKVYKKSYVVRDYQENNYLVFQVNKNESSIHIDLPEYYFKTLLSTLDDETTQNRDRLGNLIEPLQTIALRHGQLVLFDDLRTNLATLATRKGEYDRLSNVDLASSKGAHTTSMLLSAFNDVWEVFSRSLVPVSADDQSGSQCREADAEDQTEENRVDGENGAPVPNSEVDITLDKEQCEYVLDELETMVELDNANDVLVFQEQNNQLSVTQRKRAICLLLFDESANAEQGLLCGQA